MLSSIWRVGYIAHSTGVLYVVDINITIQAKVTPVITGATGIISKSLRQYLNKIPGKHDIKELQTTAILGTA
jgi:O-acetylhomoserine/O-acetylserine sulfhydrylase-like pyridoxal-dependent enzyme